MKECGKSIPRRLGDSRFVRSYFVGRGIDIGGGPDPLQIYKEFFPLLQSVETWDWEQGDAQYMASVRDETFDFVHSSHCLEHMMDPEVALRNWFRILKPGGYLIMLVPDEDMYEQGIFPSSYNNDHKWTLTIFKTQSWSQRSRNLLTMLPQLGPSVEILKIESLTQTYRYGLPRFDQTRTPLSECSIEVILRKRPEGELTKGGRLPPEGHITPQGVYLLTGEG